MNTTYDHSIWNDSQMQSRSRWAIIKVESEANQGSGILPQGLQKAQTYVSNVPFVVTEAGGKYYAFPGLLDMKP